MHIYFYVYVYTCEFRHFLESDFWLVFIPNPSIFPESGLNLHISPCCSSPQPQEESC